MADQGKWFKLWCSALTDADLENLSEKEWFCWARLGAYMKAHGDTGRITFDAPARALLSLFRLPTFDSAIMVIRSFPHCNLEEGKSTVSGETNTTVSITVEYLNWFKYQGDFSTGRVRKFREQKRKSETVQEERRRDVEEKRREETPQPPLAAPVSTSKSTANGGLEPAAKMVSTLKINGKPWEPEPEIPEIERMTQEEMEEIKAKAFAHRGQPEDDVF